MNLRLLRFRIPQPQFSLLRRSESGLPDRPLLGMVIALACGALSMSAEVLDATFNPSLSPSVWAAVTQPDGKILVGGDFQRVSGVARTYFARISAAGALESAFNAEVNGTVYAVALQPDGKIVIGGRFSSVGGRSRNLVARLNSDGTLDAGFDANVSGNYVRALFLLPDGRILIGGDFGAVGGRQRRGFAQLQASGAVDLTFDADVSGAMSATAAQGVFGIARHSDGRLLIAGQFTLVNGVTRWGLARLQANGSLDMSFNPSTTVSSVQQVDVLRDGRIAVAGGFTFMGGAPRNRLARLNSNGSLDAAFNPEPDGPVVALLEQPDGRLLVGGTFSRIGGVPRSMMARLNVDGSVDPSFSTNADRPIGSTAVYAFERSANERILVAGSFTSIDGQTRLGLARLVQPAPDVISSPASATVAAGDNITLSAAIAGSALAFQWRKDGVPIAGATTLNLPLRPALVGDSGVYDVVATNAYGSATSLPALLTVTAPPPRLVNVSVRTSLAAAQSVIVGFAVRGPAAPLLMRAAGPALRGFGLPNAMVDPRLELFRDSTKLLENDNWPDILSATFPSVGAFAFEVGSRDAALQQPITGPHSIVASGSAAGVVLVEVYDASAQPTSGRLVNISARNRVAPGDEGILIAGFSVSGSGTIRLLIRAVGPTLGGPPFGLPGVLAEPKLELYNASGVKIAENDAWSPALASTFAAVGAFPLGLGSRDAALVVTVAAGASYTAQVRAPSGAAGEALVEIYEIPD